MTLSTARRAGGKSRQAAQSSAGLRSHIAPLGALANQVRLVLHTAAYWLMLAVRDAIPKEHDLAKAEFATLRLKLLKIAARASRRIKLAMASSFPNQREYRIAHAGLAVAAR
jgi:hypothetical protein